MPTEDKVEKVVLGSSNGTIEVEAVRLNKIRANLSRLDNLREVSLDNERVARADTPGEIQKTCPGKYIIFVMSEYMISSTFDGSRRLM